MSVVGPMVPKQGSICSGAANPSVPPGMVLVAEAVASKPKVGDGDLVVFIDKDVLASVSDHRGQG